MLISFLGAQGVIYRKTTQNSMISEKLEYNVAANLPPKGPAAKGTMINQ
jgi:hypothetical protein